MIQNLSPVYRRGMDVLDWLLDGDPAIRWQVLRDLTGAPPADVAAERARVEHEVLPVALQRRHVLPGRLHATSVAVRGRWLDRRLSGPARVRHNGPMPARPSITAAGSPARPR